MIFRYTYFFRHKHMPKSISKPTGANTALLKIERLERENAEMREKLTDIRSLVIDMNMRRSSLATYIVAINAIRKLVLP